MSRDLITSLIDLTTLSGRETSEDIQNIISMAQKYKTASVCIYPQFSKLARSLSPDLNIACVGEYFPFEDRVLNDEEIKQLVEASAQEVDIVIDIQKVENKDWNGLEEELTSIISKYHRKNIKVKVILETCLWNDETIKTLSDLSIISGADFIKTSTGKSTGGATIEAVEIMLNSIKESGKRVGIKPSGGIKDYDDAMMYLNLTEKILGKDWHDPELFRFGASSLLTALWEGN